MGHFYFHRPKDNKPIPVNVGGGDVVIVPPRAYVEVDGVSQSLQRHLKSGRLVLRNPPAGAVVIRGAVAPVEGVAQEPTEFAASVQELGSGLSKSTSDAVLARNQEDEPLPGKLSEFRQYLSEVDDSDAVSLLLERERTGRDRIRWVKAIKERAAELDGGQ